MQRALCAVAVLALACLLLRSARVGLAGDYVDPAGRITAQDEALYAASAIRMATRGGWLTPMFMGRYALYKPPLLVWAAGISARILGVARLPLRLPVALACSLAVGLIFLWAAEVVSWQAGACAALLIVSNHLWHVLGGMCMTDGLLVAFYTAAMYSLFCDPWLESRLALWGFSASVAAAILTKSVAGLPPLAILALYWLAAPRKQRPTFARVCLAGALSLALAAPWFAFQIAVHGRWFAMEHFRVEILGYGAGAPPQTSQENQAMFYLMRMALTDPVLTALAVVAAPGLFRELRKRSAPAVLLVCWIGIPLVAVAGWQYRNIAYLLPLVPPLAIVAAAYGPLASPRYASWIVALAGAAFFMKAAMPEEPWGISFHRGTVQQTAPLVSDYCERARGNELILVGMDDDLYASALPLAKLRYGLVAPSLPAGQAGMPFDSMGITLTAAQFNDLPRLEPVFRERLREWGLDSAEPIGTLILAASQEDLEGMIRAHPGSDFLIPSKLRPAARSTHEVVELPGHVLLLSRTAVPRPAAAGWTCRLEQGEAVLPLK
ncbi:MAG TPA: glycosyltransferase family 39 protein [Bryobacteraceae bacterium]|nr:glycosyltransferase family 39 protein [Bryobacteraceae bacterium]